MIDLKAQSFMPEKHYEMICQWWKAQNWPLIPLDHLPKTGLVVLCEGEPAVVGFIYKTDSLFCWFEWIVANPEIRKEKRSEAIFYLIREIKSAAHEMGFKSIFTSANNESWISKLQKENFILCDRNVTQLMFQGGM